MTELQKLIKIEQEARRFGFDWPNQLSILKQIAEECDEVREELEAQADPSKLQAEIGDLLHAVISLCTFSGFDVEDTIAKINTKFSRRISILKEITDSRGLYNLQGQSIEYILSLWKEVKEREFRKMDGK